MPVAFDPPKFREEYPGPGRAALYASLNERRHLLQMWKHTLSAISPHVCDRDLDALASTTLDLYYANSGAELLLAVWKTQRLLAPFASADIHLRLIRCAHEFLGKTTARSTCAVLEAVAVKITHGSDGSNWLDFLERIAPLTEGAPEIPELLATMLPRLTKSLPIGQIPLWAADGIKLYTRDRRKRNAYFKLEDPIARQRLVVHSGAHGYDAHGPRLSYLVKALFNRELTVQVASEGQNIQRARLIGSGILMPENAPPSGVNAASYFEATVLHAMCHQLYTTKPFVVGKMKPLQVALTILLEDARVERLATNVYPGLIRFWSPFHAGVSLRATSAAGRMTRLSRVLADPHSEDDDAWVKKGRALFESKFQQSPTDQSFCEEIARILGHDLGQMRIPFDSKSDAVGPCYRDDGTGIFQPDLEDEPQHDQFEIDAAVGCAVQGHAERSDSLDDMSVETTKIRAADAVEEKGEILGVFPEWDYRLGGASAISATVRSGESRLPDLAECDRFSELLKSYSSQKSRITEITRRARTSCAQRLKRRYEGEEIDVSAVIDFIVSRRIGISGDERIYTTKRRVARDLAMALLIDTSASTEIKVAERGATVLESAAVSAALLGQALEELNDPFAMFAFSSDGIDDVRIVPIKEFSQDFGQAVARLASMKPGLSTRLGAAIRFVRSVVANRGSQRKVLIVVTDGEPADRDVSDAQYLIEDARKAVSEARKSGVDLFCVALGKDAQSSAATIFGRKNTLAIERIEELPSRLSNLYFKLTIS